MNYFTIQQMEMFFAVVENASISAAARVLYVSQPALSKTLGRLEANLGVRLFERQGGSMVLTTEGEFLYAHLKAAHTAIFTAIKAAQDMQGERGRLLRVGIHEAFNGPVERNPVRQILQTYAAQWPEMQVIEEILDHRSLRSGLLGGRLDIIFTFSFALKDMSMLQTRNIAANQWAIAIPENHPLAARDTLDIAALNGETFVFLATNQTQIQSELNLERCRQVGFMPNRMFYVQNIVSAMQMVRQGKGMAFCSRANDPGPGIKVFPIPVLPNSPYITAAWLEGNTPPKMKHMIELLP